jgi:putative membrane protein
VESTPKPKFKPRVDQALAQAFKGLTLERCYAGTHEAFNEWLLSAVALLAVANLYSGVQVNNFGSALIAAFVLGMFNTLLRPVLVVLTFPVTVLSLGLFLFVINALMFWSAAGVLDGFTVLGFSAALIGSLIYTLLGIVINSALDRLFAR